jgi:hypothetical protein
LRAVTCDERLRERTFSPTWERRPNPCVLTPQCCDAASVIHAYARRRAPSTRTFSPTWRAPTDPCALTHSAMLRRPASRHEPFHPPGERGPNPCALRNAATPRASFHPSGERGPNPCALTPVAFYAVLRQQAVSGSEEAFYRFRRPDDGASSPKPRLSRTSAQTTRRRRSVRAEKRRHGTYRKRGQPQAPPRGAYPRRPPRPYQLVTHVESTRKNLWMGPESHNEVSR